jgi:hypothetical protein
MMKFNSVSNDSRDVLGRSYVELDLSQPFEQLVGAALALPQGASPVKDEDVINSARKIYEAIHGRSVETTIGLVPVAPGIAPWLLVKHLEVKTREDFLAGSERWLSGVATSRGVIAGPRAAAAKSLPNGTNVSSANATRSFPQRKDQNGNAAVDKRSAWSSQKVELAVSV